MAEFGGQGTVEVAAARPRCFEVAAAVVAYPGWHPVYLEPGRVDCRRESGDLNEMWTTFEFVELDSGLTRVDYSTGLDPGRMLSMLARGPVIDRVRAKLVDEALAGFKRTAESG